MITGQAGHGLANAARQEPMEYADYVRELRAAHPDLAEALSRSDSIEKVLDWMQTRELPAGVVDIIGQDEFSYDFLIRLNAEDRWLVFGVN